MGGLKHVMWENRDTLGSPVLTSQISGNCPCAYCNILQIIVMLPSGQVAMLVPHKTGCGTLASWQVSISSLWLSLWLLLGTGVYGIYYRGFSQLVTPWQSHSPPQSTQCLRQWAQGLWDWKPPILSVLWFSRCTNSFHDSIIYYDCSLLKLLFAATCKHLLLCLQGNLNSHQLPWIFLFKEPDKWPQRYIMWPFTSVHLVANCHNQLSFMQKEVWFPL